VDYEGEITAKSTNYIITKLSCMVVYVGDEIAAPPMADRNDMVVNVY
jgi:hypothetical protein